jgi:hypothetical protein
MKVLWKIRLYEVKNQALYLRYDSTYSHKRTNRPLIPVQAATQHTDPVRFGQSSVIRSPYNAITLESCTTINTIMILIIINI